jgi:hypothetical protein
LWKEVKLQTYFIRHKRIDYFVITDNKERGRVFKQASNSVVLIKPKKELFKKLEKDYKNI